MFTDWESKEITNLRVNNKYNYNLLSLYQSVKISHHVRREGLEILTLLIQKREEYTLLDFMKI
jgi:hypothetical protein